VLLQAGLSWVVIKYQIHLLLFLLLIVFFVLRIAREEDSPFRLRSIYSFDILSQLNVRVRGDVERVHAGHLGYRVFTSNEIFWLLKSLKVVKVRYNALVII
jgi:hypothetical protein